MNSSHLFITDRLRLSSRIIEINNRIFTTSYCFTGSVVRAVDTYIDADNIVNVVFKLYLIFIRSINCGHIRCAKLNRVFVV